MKTDERTVNLGIKKFKREHTKSFMGVPGHPKRRSIRGKVLRDLKAEAWDIWNEAHKPKVKKLTKNQLHNKKFLEVNEMLNKAAK